MIVIFSSVSKISDFLKWKFGWVKEATYKVDKLYHGTNLSNGLKILWEGLVTNKPHEAPGFENAVYLTPDLELAARYSVFDGRIDRKDEDDFIIFEVNISQPKRTKKLNIDPLDTVDNAWGIDRDADPGREDLIYLDNFAQSIIHKVNIALNLDSDRYIDFGWELLGLNGINLVNYISRHIISKNPNLSNKQIKRIREIISQNIPRNELLTEYIYITNDSTIRIDDKFIKSFDQLFYSSDINVQQIVGAYVSDNIIYSENPKSIRPRKLPDESRDDFDMEVHNIQAAIDLIDNSEISNKEELEELLMEVHDCLDNIKDMEHIWELINGILEESDFNVVENKINAFRNDLEQMRQYIENEDYAEHRYLDPMNIVYVSLRNEDEKAELINYIKSHYNNKI